MVAIVVFLDPRRPVLLERAFAARQHVLEKCEAAGLEPPTDMLEFASHVLVCEASGQRIGASSLQDRETIGTLLGAFAGKYRNPVLVRAIAALIASSVPR